MEAARAKIPLHLQKWNSTTEMPSKSGDEGTAGTVRVTNLSKEEVMYEREMAKSNGRGRPRKENPIRTKRYNLVLPYDLYLDVEGIATAEHSTVIDAFKRIIKYGMLAYKVMKDPSSQLIIREGDTEREIVLT